MATGTLISVSEYLSTSYRPDCDYVDGRVLERNLGEFDHATLQTAVAIWFGNRRHEWNILVVVEQRVQVSQRVFVFLTFRSFPATMREIRLSEYHP
jgi:hypothetical protein